MNQTLENIYKKATTMYESIVGVTKEEVSEEDQTLEKEEPLSPTACILRRTEDTARMEAGLMACNNTPFDPCMEHLKWMFEQRGKVKVWIYNISQQEHLLNNCLIKNLHVPACKENEKYAVVTSLPAVMIQAKDNVDGNTIDYLITDGRRVAMDLINPSNLGIDQDADFRWLERVSSVGNNFSNRGVFFSTHNPPLKKELKAAHKRLKGYYLDLIDRANVVRLTSAASTLGIPTEEIKAAQSYIRTK